MRTVIGVLAVGIAAQSAMLMWRGHLSPTEMWLVGMTGTLGLSALVEAAWPDGQHGLLQFWCLTALGASGLISWAAGGDKWLGILGAVMVGLAFALAVMSSVKGRRIDAA